MKSVTNTGRLNETENHRDLDKDDLVRCQLFPLRSLVNFFDPNVLIGGTI